MAKKWHLAITKKQEGQLDKVIEFKDNENYDIEPKEFQAVEIIIPIKQDIKKAVTAAGNLASSYSIRSFEMVWDKEQNRLSFWLVSKKSDIEHYVDSFRSAYPNAEFIQLEQNVPQWFEPYKENYKVFDVSVRHGHFFAVMDYQKTPILITQISNTIQMSQRGWIQFVFQRYDATSIVNMLGRRFDSMRKKVTNTNHLSTLEMIISENKKPHEHPEFHADFARNFKTLKQHAETKTINPHVIMSIRGLVKSNDDLDFRFDVIENLSMENIHTTFEHCTKNPYDYSKFYNPEEKKADYIKINKNKTNNQRISIFPLRLIPEPEKLLKRAMNRYVDTNFWGSYHTRKPLPFLLLNTSELSLFVHLPDVTVQHLHLTRGQTLPRTNNDKTGFRFGLFDIDKNNEKNIPLNYGTIVSSNEINGAVIHPDDLTRHVYIVGGSGSGKSTLLRSLAKHVEIGNLNGTHQFAFIYADFKGGYNPDSIRFIKQLDQKTLDSKKVLYIDPSETNFAINPLELPRSYEFAKRDEIVDRYIGYFMRIMGQFYDQRQTYVQMERIMKVILQYLYVLDDAPTFRDIYEIVAELESGGQQVLPEIFATLGKPDAELQKALKSISELKSDTFSPLLNRLEPFSTSPVLRRIFTTKHSSIDFSKIVEAGYYTIVSMNETNMSSIAAPLAQMAFVLKVWFEVQEQSRKKDSKMKQVILVLDEFQIISNLDAIPMILAQARSFGLGLCLAHQNLSQISTDLLQSIVGNTATQFAGRVSGIDASKIGMIIDPHYGKELAGILAVQPDFRFVIRTRPKLGEETSLPPQFWIDYPCKEEMTDDQFREFLAEQKERHGNAKPQETLLVAKNIDKNKWLQHLDGGIAVLPSKTEWQILFVLYDRNQPLSLMEIVRICSFVQPRDKISKLLKDMLNRNLVEIAEKIPKGSVIIIKYRLTEQSRRQYFNFDYSLIGTANDVPSIIKQAVKYYLQQGYFVGAALQNLKKDNLRTDLIAYDYDNGIPISVEIESCSEVNSHPEHVLLNMQKWKEMGFLQCHVWSTHKKVIEIKERLEPVTKENVKVFVNEILN